jgi:hypothetical protein
VKRAREAAIEQRVVQDADATAHVEGGPSLGSG